MPDTLKTEDEQKKDALISVLLEHGVFKSENHQLYELTLNELEDVCRHYLQTD
ncbi:Fur-regulated basic protein FbpA [Sporolactobacillus sp. CPB3-1]|uniref:Fur-regulated basic protein FbpA n=1 Tax=Sporolactobacillus mangiferae TaxID=2940498 RepID=A0ABT0M829_9BACL|nr:Fur-regulated basic protein FbpA [Sporolactobacillus mangiferae]MCL1631017.1 Fur-regulated basic protein FbpA [Sporolactobacillus mangiferae]